nr:MAG TPA: hypothetical protein [Caudoviricetes sp.]
MITSFYMRTRMITTDTIDYINYFVFDSYS